MTTPACPLCATAATQLFYQQPGGPLALREYYRCHQCQLIHVPAAFHVNAATEKAIYDLHQNDPLAAGYRSFLNRLVEPMLERLPSGAEGLDFGCGPGPALASLFAAAGFTCLNYDIYYEPLPSRLERQYEFICSTEVVEHLAAPATVFEQLVSCLKPGGQLGIMTQRWLNLERFKGWNYRNDPTHICFFHEDTFRWLATKFDLELTIFPRDVVIFSKPTSQ